MGYQVITPPTEPVTLADARLHLRVTDTAEDALIGVWITAAREACEHYTQRSIGSQTLELRLDEFPDGAIDLPRSPVTAITSLKYIDTNGTEQNASAFRVHTGHVQPHVMGYSCTRYGMARDARRRKRRARGLCRRRGNTTGNC